MRLTFAAAAAATAFAFAAPSYSAEVFKDYVPSKEVYEVTFVHVNPNRLPDYLDGLKQTWWSACQAQKKTGTALDCAIYASTTMANRDFNVIIVIKRPSAAMTDPDEARYHAMMADLRKQLAEDKEKKLVEGYNEMRTFFGQQDFRQITFK
jgi:invasion protein IalB